MAARLILTMRQALQVTAKAAATTPAIAAAKRPAKRPAKPKPCLFGRGLPEVMPADGCLLRVGLPIQLTNKNDGRGGSYHQSAQFRKDCEARLRAWGLVRTPCEQPVIVSVYRVLGPRQKLWDSSSILRGNWKEIEDSLVACGWFHNDSPQWIHRTDPHQVSTERTKGPSIIVEIRAI